MNLHDVMTPNVEVIRPDDTLRNAAQRMRDMDVGAIPVCDGERLMGMITDRDIAIRAVAEGKNPDECQVREVMSSEIIYCFEDQDVREAAQLMEQKQIRRLPILNREKRLVGIVSLGDVAVRVGQDSMSGEALQQISRGVEEHR